jgi:1,4-alpha-glucan branching enzyme
VRAFLLSSALFWLDEYHIDGCASTPWPRCSTWTTARKKASGSPTNTAAARTSRRCFLRLLNEAVYRDHPDVQVIAEESTAWPMVSRPTYIGGLGFGMKWNMGWMHDTLKYMQADPVHRKYHHDKLTFSIWYAFTENFVLPLSHDEVVHGKGSLIGKMPGDDWQQFANLRLLSATCGRTPARSCCSWAASSASAASGSTTRRSTGGSVPVSAHGRYHALNLTLPPLGVLVFKPEGPAA